MSLFNPVMQNEKLAVIGLVIIIVIAVTGFLLFGEQPVSVESEDYVKFHYNVKYSSNDVIFDSTYNNTATKVGGTPINFFVTKDSTATPAEGYEDYYNMIGLYYIEDLVDGIKGMSKGETKTITVQPDGTHGDPVQTGDLINFTAYLGTTYELIIVDITEDAPVPEEYSELLVNSITDLYSLRESWHYIGEVNTALYSFWENSTKVTKINDTLLWMYTTPTTAIDEKFTWTEMSVDPTTGITFQVTYPVNSSYVSTLNDTHIVVTHDLAVNSTIDESVLYSGYGLIPYNTYAVESVGDEKINCSYTDYVTEQLMYKDFNKTTIIERNQSSTIINNIPREVLDTSLAYLRSYDTTFTQSCSPYLEEVVFDVEIVEVNKAATQEE